MKRLIPTLLACCASLANAEMVVQEMPYTQDGQQFSGYLVYDAGSKVQRPGILMVPNWMGVTENAVDKAKLVAADRYVVFVADVYGAGVRPKNAEEAGQEAGKLRADRPLLRKRAQKGLDVLLQQAGKLPLDTTKIAAIGFCFGGGAVLELARAGADLSAVVTFHGNLDTPHPEDAKNIKARILVLHGADDPFVNKAQVDAFEQEMQATKVDWQLVKFGNTVHSFTNPEANMPGKAQYNPDSARRAFIMMNNFFDEVFGNKAP